MPRCNFIRNAVAVSCLITVAYMSLSFFFGRHIDTESLQGTWSSLCGQYELTFYETSFSCQTGATGEFVLRGNSISLGESGVKYRMRVSRDNLVIGETVFFRTHE